MLRHCTISFHPICVYIIFSVPCSSQSCFVEEVWLLQNHLVFLLLWRSSCCCHVSSRARTLLPAGILCHNKHVSKSTPLFIDTSEIFLTEQTLAFIIIKILPLLSWFSFYFTYQKSWNSSYNSSFSFHFILFQLLISAWNLKKKKKPKMQTAITVCRRMPPVTLTWDARGRESHVFHRHEELSRGSPQGLFTRKAQPSNCVAGTLVCCTAGKYG